MSDLLTIRYRNPKTYLTNLTTVPESCPPSKHSKFLLNYPLDQKLPLPKCANSPVTFARKKIGEKIWTSNARDFNLQNRGVDYQYNALHDPHLKVFMAKPCNRSLLLKQNLINNDDAVICSLKELNAFRRYLFEQRLVDRIEPDSETSARISQRKPTKNYRERDHRAVAHDQYLKKMMNNFKILLKYEQKIEKFEDKKSKDREKLKEQVHKKSKAHQELKRSLLEKERRRMFQLKDRLAKKMMRPGCARNMTRVSSNRERKAQTIWRKKQKFRAEKIENQTKVLEKYQEKFHKAVQTRHKNFVKQWKRFDRPGKRPSH